MSDSEKEDSENEDSEYEDSECYKDNDDNEIDEIEIKYFNHIEELKKIKIESHCLLKNAKVKYIMRNDTDSEREKYTYKDYHRMCKTHWGHYQRAYGNWRYFKYCEEILDIKKINTRYVCSKERLDAIDFKIIYDYQDKHKDDKVYYYDKYIKSKNK